MLTRNKTVREHRIILTDGSKTRDKVGSALLALIKGCILPEKHDPSGRLLFRLSSGNVGCLQNNSLAKQA